MTEPTTFLHLTDTHVSSDGVPFAWDDQKVAIPGNPPPTREEVLTLLLQRLAERLASQNRVLDGVLFSGDAQSRGAPGGHELVLDLVLEHLKPFGITPDRIVATPGNHDVPRDSMPSSVERYQDFVRAWRDRGCVVPWLDGIDSMPLSAATERHRLVAADQTWAIFPVNTSNWSHVTSTLPKPLSDVWEKIPDLVAGGDAAKATALREQLQALARYDMARVSKQQLEVLRSLVAATPQPEEGRQLRIAVMHHHLRAPSLREELKPFADISNLEQVRAFLKGSGIGLALHGHKHEHAAYFDHIYGPDGEDLHRTLVISGATFEVGREADAARLITVTGLPHVPEVMIEPLSLPRAGAPSRVHPQLRRRLWASHAASAEAVVIAPGAPITVEGSDLDEVYERARVIARDDGRRGMLIVHLDLPDDDEALPLPRRYDTQDAVAGTERAAWLRELVGWWQLDRTQLEKRIPYLHGARLRRFGGKINQIERIIRLLRTKESTRAIAVLIDPFRDFTPDGTSEEFASFSLVEFRRRDSAAGRIVVDAIAFYRAQEFERWWPINVAELRTLQREICEELGYKPGRITTIAADARTISRSPTQVAMPIVDRWLDQAPARLHLLADALVHQRIQGHEQSEAVGNWHRSLGELRAATNAFNTDGIPVAIEGLATLAAYLEATALETDEPLRALARALADLAHLNASFEASQRGKADFDRWSPVAQTLLTTLERLSETRLKGAAGELSSTSDPGS